MDKCIVWICSFSIGLIGIGFYGCGGKTPEELIVEPSAQWSDAEESRENHQPETMFQIVSLSENEITGSLSPDYKEEDLKDDLLNLKDRPALSTDSIEHTNETKSKLTSLRRIRDKFKFQKDADVYSAVAECAMTYTREDEVSLRLACMSLMPFFNDTFLKNEDIPTLISSGVQSKSPIVRASAYRLLQVKPSLAESKQVKEALKEVFDSVVVGSSRATPYDDAMFDFIKIETDKLRFAFKSSSVEMYRAASALVRNAEAKTVEDELLKIVSAKRPLLHREYDFLCDLVVKPKLKLELDASKDTIALLSEKPPTVDEAYFSANCKEQNPYEKLRGIYGF